MKKLWTLVKVDIQKEEQLAKVWLRCRHVPAHNEKDNLVNLKVNSVSQAIYNESIMVI